MGRSVMTLGGDSIVAYTHFEPEHYSFFCDECDEWTDRDECEHVDEDTEIPCDSSCDHSDEFQEYLNWVQSYAIELFPSMTECDRWEDREVHIIAENAHSVVAVAEYCGLVSVSLGDNYNRQDYWYNDSDIAPLGAHWRGQVENKFLEAFGELTKIAQASNGEAFFVKSA